MAWCRKHGVLLHSPPAEMVGLEDDHGDPVMAYYAGRAGPYNKAMIGTGNTADEALISFALKHGLRAWNEE